MDMSAVSVQDLVMETVPFAIKKYVSVDEINEKLLEELIKEIVRKAMKFGLIEYDKALEIQGTSKEIAKNVIDDLKKEMKKFCTCCERPTMRTLILKKTINMKLGKITLRFIIVNNGSECGLRLIEIE